METYFTKWQIGSNGSKRMKKSFGVYWKWFLPYLIVIVAKHAEQMEWMFKIFKYCNLKGMNELVWKLAEKQYIWLWSLVDVAVILKFQLVRP